jgi:hypothetical protein
VSVAASELKKQNAELRGLQPTRAERVLALGAAVLIVASLGMAIAQVVLVPPTSDEATYASPAITLLRNGNFGSELYEPKASHLQGIDVVTYFALPGKPLTSLPLLAVFGNRVIPLRLESLVFMLGALLIVYQALQRLGLSRAFSLAAVGLLSVDRNWLLISSSARPDAQCMFCGLLGSYLFTTSMQTRNEFRAVAGGLLLGCASVTHVNGLIFGLFCLLAGSREMIRDFRNPSVYLGGAATAAVMGAYWLFTRVHPEHFEAQMSWNATVWNRLDALANPLLGLWRELPRWVYATNSDGGLRQCFYALVSAISLGALLFVVSCRWPVRKALQQIVAAYTLSALVAFTFANNISSANYFVYRTFICDISAVAMLAWLTERGVRKAAGLWLGAVVVLCAFQLSKDANALRTSRREASNYAALQGAIQRHATGTDWTNGGDELAFAFDFSKHYTVDRTYGFYSQRRPTLIILGHEGAEQLDLFSDALGGTCVGDAERSREYLAFVGPVVSEHLRRDRERLCSHLKNLATHSQTVYRGTKYDLIRIMPG